SPGFSPLVMSKSSSIFTPSTNSDSSWALSPATGDTVTSTPATLEALSNRVTSCDIIKPGKSLFETHLSLTVIALLSVILTSLQSVVGETIVCNLAILAGLFTYYWVAVHSYKLDPRCSIILDEANVLMITADFEHEQCGLLQYPAKSPKSVTKPKSLWDALFFDDRQHNADKLYRKMYGNEYAHAKKREEEEKKEKMRRRIQAVSVDRTQEASDDSRTPKE
ncbi:hypothetical protein PFISCL1PPCAC_25477, partial [Pristionchus fissidentatus]